MREEGLPKELVFVLFHHGRGDIGDHHLHVELVDYRHLKSERSLFRTNIKYIRDTVSPRTQIKQSCK